MTDEQEKALRTASALLCGMGYLEQADTINGMLAAGAKADERAMFEAWAKNKGYRFNEGDLQSAKSWAQAAWLERARLADAAGAMSVLVRKGRTAKDDIYAVAPADTAGAITWCEEGKHEN